MRRLEGEMSRSITRYVSVSQSLVRRLGCLADLFSLPGRWVCEGDFHRRSGARSHPSSCVSFVVMQERNLTQVLTTERHFSQAGFADLLANPPTGM